jgi:brefeldin A-resistance guanine nucleotide exchange factor 1
MDCLLTVVAEIHNRGKVDILHNLPSVEELRAVRQKKLLLTEGVAAFNEKPKKGIKYLQEHGILGAGASQFTEMAAFLRSEPRLDKRQIGEYISCRGGQDILSAFIKSFDLSARPLDAALRSFLTTFRLPGESRLIERIFEEFALHWFTTYTGDKVPKDTDCTFVLCYAVIQLNVDQHNKQVKNPMTIAQFRNNQRKLNGGDDFPPKYLEEIYDNIKESEIVLPAEQKGAIGEDFKWQAMLGQRTPRPGRCHTTALVGRTFTITKSLGKCGVPPSPRCAVCSTRRMTTRSRLECLRTFASAPGSRRLTTCATSLTRSSSACANGLL